MKNAFYNLGDSVQISTIVGSLARVLQTVLHQAQLHLCRNALLSSPSLDCMFCSFQITQLCLLKYFPILWHQESLG